MGQSKNNIRYKLIKAIAAILVCLFSFNEIAPALAPTSNFSRLKLLLDIKKVKGKDEFELRYNRDLLEEARDENEHLLEGEWDEFKGDVGFRAVFMVLGKALYYTRKLPISSQGLKAFVRTNLPQEFIEDHLPDRFDLDSLDYHRDSNTFTIDYRSRKTGLRRLRYFIPDNESQSHPDALHKPLIISLAGKRAIAVEVIPHPESSQMTQSLPVIDPVAHPETFIYRRDADGALTADPIGYKGSWLVRLPDKREYLSPNVVNAAVTRCAKSVSTVVYENNRLQDVERGYIYALNDLAEAAKIQPRVDYEEYRTDEVIVYLEKTSLEKKRIRVFVTEEFLLRKPDRQRCMIRETLLTERIKHAAAGETPSTADRSPVAGQARKPRVLLFNELLGTPDTNSELRLPMLFLASALKNQGIEVDVTSFPVAAYLDREDQRDRRRFEEELAKILSKNYDVIGISSCFDCVMPYAQRFTKLLRAKTDATIAIGGPLATLSPETTLAHLPEVDVLLRGEGDVAFPELVKAIHRHGRVIDDTLADRLADMDGLWFRNDNTYFINNFDSKNILSRAEFDMLQLDYSFVDGREFTSATDFNASRGCPRLCRFCARVHGRTLRQWRVEHVIAELLKYQDRLDELRNSGVEVARKAYQVMLNDDDILLNPKRAARLLTRLSELYRQGRFTLRIWSLQTSLEALMVSENGTRRVNTELIAAIAEAKDIFVANRASLLIGTDAFTDAEIRRMGKGSIKQPYTFSEIDSVIEELDMAGVENLHYLILTNPETTDEDIRETMANLIYLTDKYQWFSVPRCEPFVIPDPIIAMYKKLQEEGKEHLAHYRVEYKLPGFEEYDFFDGKQIWPHRLSFFNESDILSISNAIYTKNWADVKKMLQQYEAQQSIKKEGVAWAQRYIDAVMLKAESLQAHSGQKLHFGIETSWIPGYARGEGQHDALNPLMSLLANLEGRLQRLGIDEVTLTIGKDGEDLYDKLPDDAKEHPENLILLVGLNTRLDSRVFDHLESTETEKKAFIAMVDPYEYNKPASMPHSGQAMNIRILEMLYLSLKMHYDEEIPFSHPHVAVRPVEGASERTIVFIPAAEKIDLDLLKEKYQAELNALIAA